MQKKSKNINKKKNISILKNTLLIILSLLLISLFLLKMDFVIGDGPDKTRIDHTVSLVLSDLFSDISAPPPLPPPPFAVCGDFLHDQDGHYYKTMEIAGKCWMAENLNTGVMLASVSTMPNPNDNIIEKWCYYDALRYCEAEGGLYSWDEAMQGSSTEGAQGICPLGWHIPTDKEWYTVSALFTSDLDKFKIFFPLFPGGRLYSGSFYNRPGYQYLWSSVERNPTQANFKYLNSPYSVFITTSYLYKEHGFSVRCLMD